MIKGDSPFRVVWLSGALYSLWVEVGDGRSLVYSGSGFPGVLPKPVSQMCGSKILSIHVDARFSLLAQLEGSHCPQAVKLVQFLAEERFGCLLA